MKKKHRRRDNDFLRIDPYRLEEQWDEQPELFHDHAEESANADYAVMRAEARLELIEARLAKRIREHPEGYGVKPKPGKDVVDAAIRLEPEYQRALARLHRRKHRLGLLKAMVRSLEHRKSALENRVYMHGQGWVADKPSKRLAKLDGGAAAERRRRSIRVPLGREKDDDD